MHNIRLHKTIYGLYSLLVGVVALLLYIGNTTNPAAVFVLLYLFWLSIFFVILHISFLLLRKTPFLRLFESRGARKPFKERTAYYIASILAFMPVLILAMQSVNQLTWRDIILVLLFVGLAIFYVVKRI